VFNKKTPKYYPPVNFHFKVEFVDGDDLKSGKVLAEVSFTEVGGLSMELGVEELSEGGENRYTHRLPTKTKFGNLSLKRGMLRGDSEIVKWVIDAIANHSFKPYTIFVSLLNFNHEAIRVWKFTKAWPLKWVTGDLKATDNAIVVETLDLAYAFFTVENPKVAEVDPQKQFKESRIPTLPSL
jgi:phage tail-like protein